MKNKNTAGTIFFLLIFLLSFPAHSAPGKKRLILSIPATEKLAFQQENMRASIKSYIDKKRVPNGMIPSFSDSSSYVFGMDTGKFHQSFYGKMGYLEEQSYTYDMGVAIIGMLLLGDRKNAERILDILEEEFYLPKNGIYGLYNSYLVTSNIPVEDLKLGADGDRLHAGPTLWVILAALNHMKLVRNTRYLEFILDMVIWCQKLTYYRFEDSARGAISMGFGWGPDWSKIFSTEHNVDYFAVLKFLYDIYRESSPEVRAIFHEKGFDDKKLMDEMEHVGRWVMEIAFDKELYCFIAGVNQFGVDRLMILDGTSWGLGGVSPQYFADKGIDLDKLIESTRKNFQSVYKLPDGRLIEGFDFTDEEGTGYSRGKLVWFEGTGQMVIAFGELARYFYGKGDEERAVKYKNEAIRYTNYMYLFTSYYHLDGTLPYMAIQTGEKQVVKTLKYEWEIPRGKKGEWVRSLSSTMWFLYCLYDFYNPMKWEID